MRGWEIKYRPISCAGILRWQLKCRPISCAGILAAGTNMGNIALWKFTPSLSGKKREGEDLWSLQAPATVEGPVRKVEVSVKGKIRESV